MWYRFEEGNPIGVLDVKYYQVAWYNNGVCFDEDFFTPDEIESVITYVETIEDTKREDRSRVFVCFGNGDKYELKLEKIE